MYQNDREIDSFLSMYIIIWVKFSFRGSRITFVSEKWQKTLFLAVLKKIRHVKLTHKCDKKTIFFKVKTSPSAKLNFADDDVFIFSKNIVLTTLMG